MGAAHSVCGALSASRSRVARESVIPLSFVSAGVYSPGILEFSHFFFLTDWSPLSSQRNGMITTFFCTSVLVCIITTQRLFSKLDFSALRIQIYFLQTFRVLLCFSLPSFVFRFVF